MKISKQNPMPYPECRGSTITYPCYAELKLDGELNWYDSGKLINKSGKTRTDCPITNELSNCKDILIGELYLNYGRSGELYEFLKHQKSDNLLYCVFDILLRDLSYEDRREHLLGTVKETDHVKIVPTWYIENKQELDELKQQLFNLNYEGLVVKRPQSRFRVGPLDWVKIKHKDQSDFTIKHVDPSQERAEVWVPTPGGGSIVGVKIANKYKPRLRPGHNITIEHQGILKDGGLRHPVYIPKEKGGVL